MRFVYHNAGRKMEPHKNLKGFMQNQPTKQASAPITPTDEMILVVKREKLFPQGDWQGIKKVNFDDYLAIIKAHQEFLPRPRMEQDLAYKQIIPYLIFTHKGSYFLMQRHKKASEQRLKNKLTLGIGGHIRQEDMQTDSLFDWARREFHEEVEYNGSLKIEPIGLLNDDSSEVGQVHIGFVFLLHGDSSDISVKSELASGALVSLKECVGQKELMESWSGIVVEALINSTS